MRLWTRPRCRPPWCRPRRLGFGKAQVGDKTDIDAIVVFADDHPGRRRAEDAWQHAAAVAEKAAKQTAQLAAKLGRARSHAQRASTRPGARCPSHSSARHRGRWGEMGPADHGPLHDRLQPQDVLLPTGARWSGCRRSRYRAMVTVGRAGGALFVIPTFPTRGRAARPSRSVGRTCTCRILGPFTGEVSGAELAGRSRSATPSVARCSARPTRSWRARRWPGCGNGLAPVLIGLNGRAGRAGPRGRTLHRAAGIRIGARARVGGRATAGGLRTGLGDRCLRQRPRRSTSMRCAGRCACTSRVTSCSPTRR